MSAKISGKTLKIPRNRYKKRPLRPLFLFLSDL
nr:MAG TPA: hypothetical protein [Caudoviricetes sp.]